MTAQHSGAISEAEEGVTVTGRKRLQWPSGHPVSLRGGWVQVCMLSFQTAIPCLISLPVYRLIRGLTQS